MSTPWEVQVSRGRWRARLCASGRILNAGYVMPHWYHRLRNDRLDEAQTVDLSFMYRLCPYYRGTGSCGGGCWEEPVCRTSQPARGWPRPALTIDRIAERLGVPARARLKGHP